MTNRHNGSRYRRAQAQCMADGEARRTPCYRCGQPIDYEFTRRYPRHRLAGTAHHLTPLLMGGDLHGELAPCHRGCNAIMGNQLRGLLRHGTAYRPLTAISSRDW